MKNKQMPIYEPGLDVLFERNIDAGRLRFTTNLKEGIESAKIIFLALPTPEDEDGSADLSYILGVAEEIGDLIDDYKVIVDKSTSKEYYSTPQEKFEKLNKINPLLDQFKKDLKLDL